MRAQEGQSLWIFDHIAVMAENLEEGADFVENALGVRPTGGGRHPAMGTWNHVLSLGSGEYLEVISIDPSAPRPERSRWFDLDNFSGDPKIGTWLCRTSDLVMELSTATPALGRGTPMRRDDFTWEFAVADDGTMPFEGAHPILLQWNCPHPTERMPDHGLRLKELVVSHPDPNLAEQMKIRDPRLAFNTSASLGIKALIETPTGDKWLG